MRGSCIDEILSCEGHVILLIDCQSKITVIRLMLEMGLSMFI